MSISVYISRSVSAFVGEREREREQSRRWWAADGVGSGSGTSTMTGTRRRRVSDMSACISEGVGAGESGAELDTDDELGGATEGGAESRVTQFDTDKDALLEDGCVDADLEGDKTSSAVYSDTSWPMRSAVSSSSSCADESRRCARSAATMRNRSSMAAMSSCTRWTSSPSATSSIFHRSLESLSLSVCSCHSVDARSTQKPSS
ncbi:hypothetical protein DFH08DRAFT_862829 [Mycena albidolilacea]|uniref:Uncharacterized protein n=1 Tax=Mycena albidolilacea TaxID=1033008 RepID=A0AAD7A4Z8_9AGAR|nr:hypothetical protein DFH08DRAFT_862829 [Mycena albidolilacea]